MVITSVTKTIEEDTQRAAAEVQLQKYGKFFEDYFNSLIKIEDRLLPYSRNLNNGIISINFKPKEQAIATDLINCDNKIINKILIVFSTLCSEVAYLEEEAKLKYINLILYYGEGFQDGDASYEDCQLLVSKLLPALQDLSNFIKSCERIVLEILSQLSAFYNMGLDICNRNLCQVFESLADILIILVIIQEIIANNNTLIYHWSLYKRTIQLASHKANEFNYDIAKINQLDKLIEKLETQLLSQKIFKNVLSLPFDKKISVRKNKKLSDEFNSYFKTLVADLEKATQQHENIESMTKWAKICITFVLTVNVFGSYDKKFLKTLSGSVKKFPLITLHANVTFRIDEFILSHTNHILKPNEKKMLLKENNSQQFLIEATQKINNDIPWYAMQVLCWIIKMEEMLRRDSTSLRTEHLKDISNLLLEGIRYCSCIKMILSTISNLYITLKKPMTKTSAISFCKLVEILKCAEFTYSRHHIAIAAIINYIVQYAEHECLNVINDVKNQLVKDKNFKQGHVDTISSLVISEDALNGPATELRVLIGNICANLFGPVQSESEKRQLTELFNKLSTVSTLQNKLESVSECAFMYWNKGTLPIYFSEVNNKRQNLNHIDQLLHALLKLPQSNFTNESIISTIYENLTNETLDQLFSNVIEPLCNKMEENLRLHVLQHLQCHKRILQDQNFQLNHFLTVEPIYFCNTYVDVKWCVEKYLSETFYDLTTVALHDWQIYGEMRTLADQKFNVHTVDDNLPNQSLEQGLDLLEITRNISTFVSNYFYNLNNQIFIEISSHNKHLNVINIRHIANSIRTHGMGIMNTAVNYTYQFLRQKLNNFSQFLYDEQINSRLLKEITIYKEQSADQIMPKYSFERVERFNRGIEKLGVTRDGTTYLDKFRDLITHIGNALAYIRMIKSGGLHYSSNAAKFIPNLKNIKKFEQLCKEDVLSDTSCQAAYHLDNAINHMSSNIADGTNYFQLLVDVFAPVLRDGKNNHLRNFYIIIPSLTINFVEYLITAKENMLKKNKTTASFTDDGFVIGITYMLQVLNLYAEFDSLHWFQSVEERNNTTIKNLNSQISSMSNDNTNLQHTLNLSLKRLHVYQQEFKLLYYTLYSARVLFENRNENHSKYEEENN